jgi:hypothetical protein
MDYPVFGSMIAILEKKENLFLPDPPEHNFFTDIGTHVIVRRIFGKQRRDFVISNGFSMQT